MTTTDPVVATTGSGGTAGHGGLGGTSRAAAPRHGRLAGA